jgi:SAM-dependent methyltransferase
MADDVAYWDERAVRYDDEYDLPGPRGYALRTRMSVVVEALGVAEGTVLDAGMGGGRLCAELAKVGWEPSGIDPAAGMVELARSRFPGAAARFVQGRLEQLPFADATFDGVVATGSLEYADVRRSIAELARVLRPGGKAVLTYPNPEAFYAIWKTGVFYPAIRVWKRLARRPHPDLPRGFPPIPARSFLRLLGENDLVPGAVTYTGYAPLLTPLDTLLPRLSEALSRRFDRRRLDPRRFSTQVVYTAQKRSA